MARMHNQNIRRTLESLELAMMINTTSSENNCDFTSEQQMDTTNSPCQQPDDAINDKLSPILQDNHGPSAPQETAFSFPYKTIENDNQHT